MDCDVEALLQVKADLGAVGAAQGDALFASHPLVAGLVFDIEILLDHCQLQDLVRPFVDDLLIDRHLRGQPKRVLHRLSQFPGNGQGLFGEVDEHQPCRHPEQDKQEGKNADDDDGCITHGL